MSSRGKKKTTMAKLNREMRLRERRDTKKARKVARRAAADSPDPELQPFDEFSDDPEAVGEPELDRELR